MSADTRPTVPYEQVREDHESRRVSAYRDDALGSLDATGVAEEIRAGRISATEAVEAAIARVAAVDPELGATTVLDTDRARERAAAIATDANGRFTKLDPATGAAQALAESYRNVCTVGAKPLAVSDCLNFGSPEDPDAMWQLVEAITGLADACQVMGVPVTGGNVSLYNSHGKVKGLLDSSINPTPVVCVLGVIDDVRRANPSGWSDEGLAIIALGTTEDELDGSAWTRVVHDHLGGLPPKVDLEEEMALGRVLLALSEADMPDGSRIVRAAHDLAAGGLVQTLVDAVLRQGVGASVDLSALPGDVDDFTALFSESGARAVIAVPEAALPVVAAAAEAEDIAWGRLGTTGGDLLVINGSDLLADGGAGQPLVLDLDELRAGVEGTLPAIF